MHVVTGPAERRTFLKADAHVPESVLRHLVGAGAGSARPSP